MLAVETRWIRHHSRMRRIPWTAVLVPALAVVASCGSEDVRWPTAADSIDVQGISWVNGNTFGDAGGPGRLVDHGSHPFKEKGDQILSPWWANRTEDGQGVWNPSRESYIDNASNRGASFVHDDGRPTHPHPRGQYYLLGWIDDRQRTRRPGDS